jgi:hypothetical protein
MSKAQMGEKNWNWKGGRGHRVICKGNGQAQANNPNWKGGQFKDRYGYTRIRVGRCSYTPEHRLVMERKLDRKLLKSEIVHHIDFDRGNNSQENLVVMGRADHTHYHRNMNRLYDHWVGA